MFFESLIYSFALFPIFIFLVISKHKEFNVLLGTCDHNTAMLQTKSNLFAHKY